jgi:prepilin-type N-terminal cleavage/methylation domain-containing protein
MSHSKCSARCGYTLIEVLVVTGILAMVLTVIAACLAGGIRVWGAARTYGRLESSVLLDLAFLEKDLMRAVPFFGVPCRGTSEQVDFPALLRRPDAGQGEKLRNGEAIGTIRYSYARERGVLMKKQWVFPQAEPADAEAEELLNGMEECRIEYGSLPAVSGAPVAGEEVTWNRAWTVATNLPVGVRFEIAMRRDGESMRFRKTVFLPVHLGDLKAAE